jgi:alpha-tubulin suppressor-like RCC1 family protein
MYRLIIAILAGLIVFLFVLTCADTATNPFSPDKAGISLLLKSSNYQESDTSVTDTVGERVRIGVCLYLTQHIDSTEISIASSTKIDTIIWCRKKDKQIDTAFYDVLFSNAGDHTVTATAHVGKDLRQVTATIHIVTRPVPNRPPVLAVTGNRSVVAGQTCSLTVTATDPDSGQTVTIDTLKCPAGSSFQNNTFSWTTAIADTGVYTVMFIARDNGTPVITDIDTAFVFVTATRTNHPPKWNKDTVELTGQLGSPVSLTLADKCSDPDNDPLAFHILPGAPDSDTITGATYSFTPAAAHEGTYYPRVVARDSSGAEDTLTIKLTISVSDSTPPNLTLLSPSKDTVIAADSCRIQVKCTDASGIASVTMAIGAGTAVTATRSSDSIFTATVKPLTAGQFSTITITAVDAATAANRDTAFIRIKYDNDRTPPHLVRLSPAKDSTSINSNSITVRMTATDASGIALVTCNLGSNAFSISESSDSVYTATVTGLVQDQFNIITFIATDSSLAANSCTLSVHIKYDPTMLDSAGPVIIQKIGPASGSVITDPVIAITDSILDPSDIDSVYWTLNNVWAGAMTLVSGSITNYTLRDTLTTFHSNRIVIHAIDSSIRRNHDSAVVVLDYNLPPVSNDTAVSTNRNVAKTWTLNFQSPDSDTLTWTRLTSPSSLSGMVTGMLPSVTFTPATNWSGIDSFYVRVTDGYWSDTAKIKITVTDILVAPVILTQPANLIKTIGQSATLSVTINQDVNPPPSYLWKKNGSEITGANGPSYSIGSVAASDSGSYTVTVSNSAGTVTSQAAILTVHFAPAIMTQPQSQTLYLGQSATFTVLARGNPAPTYQWKKNGTVINGMTGATYIISSPSITDSGMYTVSVMNILDTVMSDTARFYAKVKSIAAGAGHSLFIKTDGTLWATGFNSSGELGDGTTTDRLFPFQMMTGVSAVSAGNGYTMILKMDSTLWATGHNGSGQLGDGSNTNRTTPILIMSSVKAVSARNMHTLILKTDGTLLATGANFGGQLGDGTTTDRNSPHQLASGVSSASAGGAHTMFIKSDGTLWATGYNNHGQLCDGTTTDRNTPFQITSAVSSVVSGDAYTMILKTDGTLLAAGYNALGQLGDGTISDRFIPVDIASNVSTVSTSILHSLFIKTDGTLWVMGCNEKGELGDNTTINRLFPVEITINEIRGHIAACSAGDDHSMAITTDGMVFVSGDNRFGQLGDGSTTGSLVFKLLIY